MSSLLYVLLIIPVIGIFLISTIHSFYPVTGPSYRQKFKKEEDTRQQKTYLYISEGDIFNTYNKEDSRLRLPFIQNESIFNVSYYKNIAFITTVLNVIVSLIIYMLFDFNNNQFQFIQENLDLSFYDIYLGVDGVSIYFVVRRLTSVEPTLLRVTTRSMLCKPTDLPEMETWREPKHVSKVFAKEK